MATVVKADQKAPFSIATTLRCREGCYSFPLIATLYPWYIPYICWVLSMEVSSTIFKVFGMTRTEIEPRPLGPLANTLTTGPIVLFHYQHQMAKRKFRMSGDGLQGLHVACRLLVGGTCSRQMIVQCWRSLLFFDSA